MTTIDFSQRQSEMDRACINFCVVSPQSLSESRVTPRSFFPPLPNLIPPFFLSRERFYALLRAVCHTKLT